MQRKSTHLWTSSFVFFYVLGNKPPGMVPNKFKYMTSDLQRLSKYFDVPISSPADPFEVMFQKGIFIPHKLS